MTNSGVLAIGVPATPPGPALRAEVEIKAATGSTSTSIVYAVRANAHHRNSLFLRNLIHFMFTPSRYEALHGLRRNPASHPFARTCSFS